jgi:hypothetical protein
MQSLSWRTVFIAAALRVLPALADEQSGERPGDDTLTCQQIATKIAPGANQMGASWRPVGETAQQQVRTGQAEVAREAPTAAARTAAATAAIAASAAGVPGATGSVVQAEMAKKQRVWAEAKAEQKPIRPSQCAVEASAHARPGHVGRRSATMVVQADEKQKLSRMAAKVSTG